MENEIIFQLILATLLGALIGLEREIKRKEAGLQTFSLLSLGTCLFTIISLELYNLFFGKSGFNFDPSQIVHAVAIGTGFIGAGAIFHKTSGIKGLTTAAGLWVTSAIGIAVGAKFYFLAIFTTFLILVVLAGIGLLEERFFKRP